MKQEYSVKMLEKEDPDNYILEVYKQFSGTGIPRFDNTRRIGYIKLPKNKENERMFKKIQKGIEEAVSSNPNLINS